MKVPGMLRILWLVALAVGVSACSDTKRPLRIDSGSTNGETKDGAPDATPEASRVSDSGTTPDATAAAPDGVESVRFTVSYGECAGFCQHTLTVRPNDATLGSATSGGVPTVDEAIDLDPAVREQILAAAAQALMSPWESSYGCPDCADQGAYHIGVSANGILRETVLDPEPLQHPTFFDPLLDAIKPVLAAHPGPKSICAVAPGDCTAGRVSLVLSLGTDGAIEPTWYNDLDHSVFLPGCTTVTFERTESGTVTWTGPAAVCAWEGVARVLGFADLLGDVALSTKGKPGTYRATGTYYEGCSAGKPISQAACTAQTLVTSNSIVIAQ